MLEELDTNSMARVCQTCGHVGYKELLLCCNKCQISVEHRYCLAKIPPADDEGLTYICALCVSSSANQTSEQYVLHPSRRRKHRRQRIDQPAACVQDLKEIAVSRTSVAELEAKEATRDPPPSLLTSNSEPVVEDATCIENLEKISTKGEKINLHTSAAEPLVRDVVPQPEPNENNRSPPRNDQPTEFLQDLTRWQVTGEAELQRYDIPANSQTSVFECPTSLSKPSVKHMLPQADLNESNRSPSIDQSATFLQEFKKRLAKGEAKQQTCGVPHCLQTSISHLGKDVLPQAGANGSCPSRIDRTAKGDLKLQTCDVPLYLQTSVSEISAKDVAPQAHLKGNDRILFKLDQPAALVQGLKKRQADSSTLANVVAEVQTCDVSPSVRTSSCNPFVKDVLADAGIKEKSSSMQHAENRYRDKEVNGKRRRTGHDDWDKRDVVDRDFEGQQLQVVPVAPVDKVVSRIPLQITSPQSFLEHTNYVFAQPIIDPAWRGCLEICGEKYGRFVAHLSNKACGLKVVEAAKTLPVVLCTKIVPRLEAWPPSFNASAPTDDNIALYFFPAENDSVVKAFDGLVNRIIKRDLALKVVLDTAQLLIFSSNQLPIPYWRFNGKYYLWGVFRRRDDSVSRESGDGRNEQHSSTSRESLQMSPLSMSGSYSSGSPRSPLNNKTLSSKSCTLKLVSASNSAK